jgi:hypothetical protein
MASIKCGKCQETHESVQAVKSCYAGQKTTAPATFRENKYAGVCALCGETVEAETGRILPKDGVQSYDVLHLAGQCPKAASPALAASPRRDFSAVTGGYYATVSATGNNDYDFWYVKEGQKPGYRFVKRYIGGSGPIRISGGEAIRALQTILAEGVEKCGLRFADEHQRCWKCGLPLTDELSRSRRQGPVCWAKD